MRKNWFIWLCLLTVLVMLCGAIVKHTVLAGECVEVIHMYSARYTVLVEDVPEETAQMFFDGMLLLLDETTTAGNVTQVELQPPASGKEGCRDVILQVKVKGGSLENGMPDRVQFERDNQVTFYNRFITFEGTITEMTTEEG